MSAQRSESGVWMTASLPIGDDSPGAYIVEGERRLMTAVLVHALRGLFQDAARPGRGAARRLHQDLGWLTSPDRTDVFSFERICESLSLDSDTVRQHVLKQLGASTSVLTAAPSHRPRMRRRIPAPSFFEPLLAVG